MNEKDLFENNCFLPCWTEEAEYEKDEPVRQKKDLTTLLAELEEIKNHIENIKAKQWHLAKLVKYNRAGIAAQ